MVDARWNESSLPTSVRLCSQDNLRYMGVKTWHRVFDDLRLHRRVFKIGKLKRVVKKGPADVNHGESLSMKIHLV